MKAAERAKAKSEGKTRYFTGRPCKYGHVAQRRVSTKRCTECERKDRNPVRQLAYTRKHRAENPGNTARTNARRRAAQLKATPKWADSAAIDMKYATRAAAQELFEIPVHVDHTVPLISTLVCGLHVEANLCLLPGPENSRKSNRTWPDMWS